MTSVYGLLPAPVNDYTTTVIPVLISVPVLWRVECFFQRVIPKAVAFSFVPFATMLVMVPVSLCITAPAGSYLGMLLGQLMFMLGNSGGIVSLLTLMGLAAGWEFLKIAGVSNVCPIACLCSVYECGNGFVHPDRRDDGDVRRLGHALWRVAPRCG